MAAKSRGRLVAGVNGTVATLLVVLLAVVALVVKPPAPPGIAEFAPQATKPITKAPPGQAAAHGSGPGACVAGQVCAVVAPSASTRPLPSTSPLPQAAATVQCYRWPDGSVTQTFDPQSPPCIASWPERAQGNGGATSRGVTGSEVQITMSKDTISNGTSVISTSFEPYVRQLLDFFNDNYQFYGRKLHLVINSGAAGDTPSAAHAAAQSALGVDAFAAALKISDDGYMSDDLSHGKMINVNFGASAHAKAASYAKNAPYAWSYEPPVDTVAQNLAAFVCTSLKGKKARFSSDSATRDLTRKFVIHNSWQTKAGDRQVETDAAPLRAALRACGIEADVVTTEDSDAVANTQNGQGAAVTMQNQGITTVLSLDSCCSQQFEAFANQVNWHPEWVYYGEDRQYTEVAQQDRQNGQATNRIGLAPANKDIPLLEEPYYRAAPVHYRTAPAKFAWREFYTSLQIIAAGVQMAGPHLTPETFARGLYTTEFPNPGAAAAPSYQAAVSFSASEPWAVHDYAVWWPDTTRAPEPTQREYPLCFSGNGRRWRLGTWVDLEKSVKGGPQGC